MNDLWGRIEETINSELGYTGEKELSAHLTDAIFHAVYFSRENLTTQSGKTLSRWLTRWEYT